MHKWTCVIMLAATATAGCRERGEEGQARGLEREPEQAAPSLTDPEPRAQARQEPAPEPVPPARAPAQDDAPAPRADVRPELVPPAQALAGAGLWAPAARVERTLERAASFVDTNDDGRISKEEANSAVDLYVGGYFFQADADGNGVVTPAEARNARAAFKEQQPMIGTLFETIRDKTGESPFAALARLLDVEYGKPLTLAEARRAGRTGAARAVAALDRNGDGSVTPAEAREVGASATGELAFKAADRNQDGAVALGELQSALNDAGSAAFRAADENGDGKLTQVEASQGLQKLAEQLGSSRR